MKKLFIITTLLLISLLQLSCSKGEDQTTNPIVENQIDVYVTGTKDGKACYWKNSQLVMLESGTFPFTEANKIIVSNGNVYVLGIAREPSLHSMLFWKNGILTNLSNTLVSTNEKLDSFDMDMEVAGNDVYFIGYVKNSVNYQFNYWKNNVKTILSDGGYKLVNGININVVANTIYITGVNGSKLGYYINTTFYEANPNSGFVQKNSDVYYYYYIAGSFIANLNNLNTNVSSTFPVNDYIKKMTFVNNNFYYLERNKLYKEGGIFLTNSVLDFSVVNNNVYKIIGVIETNAPRSLQLNDTNIITSTTGERFNSLFIDQN